jgi:hypothetical protein
MALIGTHTREDFKTDLVFDGLNLLKSPAMYGVLRIVLRIESLKIENLVDLVQRIKSLASSLIKKIGSGGYP